MAVPDTFIPYGRQTIEDDDLAAVAKVLQSDFLTTGPAGQELEEAFARVTKARHAVSCSSGTAALHLAALALDLGPGDWAVVPSLTFLATANAVRLAGADVVFCDVDPDTGLMTGETLAEALERARQAGHTVKAVFPVHLNGQCCDLEAIAPIARDAGAAIVEDACHALGGTVKQGVPVGACSHSDIAIFSLHPVKAITSGEGGMLTTNDAGLAEKAALLRNHGMTREQDTFENAALAFDEQGNANPWYYEMQQVGLNYRLSDIHAALALNQLGKLERFAARRRELMARYDRALAPLAPIVRPVKRLPHQNPAWHLYAVHIDFTKAGLTRAELMNKLRDHGIGTQVHYIPVHRQPYYTRRYGAQPLSGADAYYARILSLPFYPAMGDEDVGRVATALSECLAL